ncbi:MAG: biopolymer transporter ExbD [Pseudomonadota bacterium]
MSQSRRARRMERNHKKGKSVPLNLVSLMDIFTILVFFLLVNSTEVEVLPNAKSVQIPESAASTRPRETVVVMVTGDKVLVQGEFVGTLDEVLAARGNVFPPLKAALENQSKRLLTTGSLDENAQSEVTILGDKTTSYSVLRKIMATCTDANYGRVSLAVMQKNTQPPA